MEAHGKKKKSKANLSRESPIIKPPFILITRRKPFGKKKKNQITETRRRKENATLHMKRKVQFPGKGSLFSVGICV
jgi:hypothetical protein